MPSGNKYQAALENFVVVQNMVNDYVKELPGSANDINKEDEVQRIAQGIHFMAQALINAGNAWSLSVSLVRALNDITNSVLAITGKTSLDDGDGLPIPEIKDEATFKLGLATLKLLSTLNLDAAKDYADTLSLAPGWDDRLSKSPNVLIDRLVKFFKNADDETTEHLLNIENLPEQLKTKFTSAKAIQEAEILSIRSPNLLAISGQITPIVKIARRTKLIMKGFCLQYADTLNPETIDSSKVNIVKLSNDEYHLCWLDKSNKIATHVLNNATIIAANLEFPENLGETSDMGYITFDNQSPEQKSAYTHIKNIIKFNIHIQLTDLRITSNTILDLEQQQKQALKQDIPTKEVHTINNAVSDESENSVDSTDSQTTLLDNVTNVVKVGAAGTLGFALGGPPLAAFISTVVAGQVIGHEQKHSAHIRTEFTNTLSLQAAKDLKAWIEKLEEIKGSLREFDATLEYRALALVNYLKSSQEKLSEFYSSNAENRLNIFENGINDLELPRYTDEDTLEILERNVIDIQFDENKTNNLPEDLKEIPGRQKDYLIAEIAALRKRKQEIVSREAKAHAEVTALPGKVRDDSEKGVFTAFAITLERKAPSWYLQALKKPATPYLAGIAFAIGVAAAIISIGLLLNSPEFAIFSIQALANIATPLCLAGAIGGGAAALAGGTGLVTAGMFSNLRNYKEPKIDTSLDRAMVV